jgi:hypothetical protein
LLELAHVLGAPDALAGLGHLPRSRTTRMARSVHERGPGCLRQCVSEAGRRTWEGASARFGVLVLSPSGRVTVSVSVFWYYPAKALRSYVCLAYRIGA